MKKVSPAILLTLLSAYAYADLPSSPLNSTFTLTGSQTLTNSQYEVASSGVLKIGSDTDGSGELIFSYSSASNGKTLLKNDGIINVGTDTTEGIIRFTGTESTVTASATNGSSGTVNINKKGTWIVDGYARDTWWTFSIMPSTVNLYGTMKISAAASGPNKADPYFGIKNMNFYAGAILTSDRTIRNENSTWNIYSSGISAQYIRVGTGANTTSTINLLGEDVIANLTCISMDSADSTLKLGVGNYDNTIKELRLNTNSKVNIKLPEIKTGNILYINSFSNKDNASNKTGAKISIEYFANDYICVTDANGLEISEDNRLFIKDKNTYVDLIAYDGAMLSENLIDGKWYLEEDGFGRYYLNNTGFIPEPSSIAGILGALSLGAILYSRRKK